MAGSIQTEIADKSSPLTLTREPKAPKRAGDPGSLGDQALKDAVIIILACWVLLFLLAFSLRKYNV
jgi:hypothetical protein